MDSKYDVGALFKIGYGLYVVTASDDMGRDNGCINKLNYTHDYICPTCKHSADSFELVE